MNKLLFVLFTLFPAVALCQDRQLLKGKVVADMIKADNLTVKNLTADTSTVTDAEGNFSINARVDDILEFSSIIFKTLEHTLKSKDFKEELFVVRVEPSAIILDEVQLTGLSGNLAIDSKNTKVILLNNLIESAAEINKNVHPNNPNLNMNYIAIAELIGRAIFPGSKSKASSNKDAVYRKASVEHKSFSKVLNESFPESFFTKTIGVPKEKLGLFLHFCNEDAKRYLLDPKNEDELIAYLKKKYVQYQYQTDNNEN